MMKRMFQNVMLVVGSVSLIGLLAGCPKKQVVAADGSIIIMGLMKAPADAIKQLAPSKYRISKDWFKQFLKGNDTTAAMKMEGTGFRLMQIKPGSFWNQTGLRNGDIIVGINGKDPKNFQAELERMQSPMVIKVTRDGSNFSFNYVFE